MPVSPTALMWPIALGYPFLRVHPSDTWCFCFNRTREGHARASFHCRALPFQYRFTASQHCLFSVFSLRLRWPSDLRTQLSVYPEGGEYMHTPNFERLAKNSVVFERAYVQVGRVREWLAAASAMMATPIC